MQMYQRPTYHWKLECSTKGEHTVNAALYELQNMIDDDEPAYLAMIRSFGSFGVLSTFIYAFTICVMPIGMVLGTLFMIKPMLVTNELHDLLESEKIYEIPTWIN